jgi:Uma2 family endonuclease
MGLRDEKQSEEIIPQKLTFEEYIRIEQENGQKYEYHDGFIVAMSGGSLNHARLCTNISAEIHADIKKKGDKCETFGSEAKLAIEVENKYLYPDAMIICGEVKESEHQNQAVTNPNVIIEVLSKSTEKYDKKDKFRLYRQIESLEYYVLIEQDSYQIEVHRKMDTKKGGNISLWQIEVITGIDSMLSFPTLDIEISFADIYKNIKFEDKKDKENN